MRRTARAVVQQQNRRLGLVESPPDCAPSAGTLLTPPAGGPIDDLVIDVLQPNLTFSMGSTRSRWAGSPDPHNPAPDEIQPRKRPHRATLSSRQPDTP